MDLKTKQKHIQFKKYETHKKDKYQYIYDIFSIDHDQFHWKHYVKIFLCEEESLDANRDETTLHKNATQRNTTLQL